MIITPLLVVFVSLVFVLLFLFLNTVDKRKWLTLLISLILTPLVYFYMAYPFINIVSNYHHQKYFNAEAWAKKPTLRYEMIDFIIQSDTLKGKTPKEIKKLLGEPEWLTWDEENKMHYDTQWNYSLGIEPGAFTTQKEQLEVIFKNDKVINYKLSKEPITFDEEQ